MASAECGVIFFQHDYFVLQKDTSLLICAAGEVTQLGEGSTVTKGTTPEHETLSPEIHTEVGWSFSQVWYYKFNLMQAYRYIKL